VNSVPTQKSGISDEQCVQVYVIFKTAEQASLLERLIKRITRSDLRALMFAETEINPLLSALGSVRAPIKELRIVTLQKPSDS